MIWLDIMFDLSFLQISGYFQDNDAILLVITPAAQAPGISSSQALRIAKEYDAESGFPVKLMSCYMLVSETYVELFSFGNLFFLSWNFLTNLTLFLLITIIFFLVSGFCFLIVSNRTIGVISKIDQAAGEPKILAAVQALLLNQGPQSTSDIQWVALIGQSVSIASAQSGNAGSENSLETAWQAESETLKSIFTGAPQNKSSFGGHPCSADRNRMKVRLPNLLSGHLLFLATVWTSI